MAACALCAGIPDVASANTGRDQHFGSPITSLRALGIDRDDDLWECPECGALFLWHDDTAQTGSGNNDEEVLTRLPAPHADVVRAFVHRGDAPVHALDPSLLFALPETLRTLALTAIRAKDRPLALALVPAMLDVVVAGPDVRATAWASDFVKSVSRGEDAAVVSAELGRRPPHLRLDALRTHLKQTLCTVCSTIPHYPRLTTRRDGPLPHPLGALVQVGASDTLDAWECPECASMFIWEKKDGSDEGTLSRLLDYAGASLRACLRRTGPVSENDREMVFASDRYRATKIVLAHAAKHDRALVHELLPTILMRLAVYRPEWLRDFMIDFVRDSTDAAAVLEAIAKSGRTGAMVDVVAAHCRRIPA